MNATSAVEDRAVEAARGAGDATCSAIAELIDIIERLDSEIAKRDERIEELEGEVSSISGRAS